MQQKKRLSRKVEDHESWTAAKEAAIYAREALLRIQRAQTAKILVKLVIWRTKAAVSSLQESFGYSKLAPL